MTKRNDSKNVRTTTQACFLDRDDVDNAILEYIHANWPETEGLDITKWDFRRGEVEVTFDLETYKNLGTVSAREHNEVLFENEQLQSDIEELESDREYLSGEVDGLNEEILRIDQENEDTIEEYEEHITSLERQLEAALNKLDSLKAPKPRRRKVAPVGHSDDEDCAHCDHA